MPGIIAIASKNINKNALLDKMIKSIKHQDNYKIDKFNSDFFSGARVHFGIFNPEKQPVFNEDKSICILMDGKIFDYKGSENNLEFCLRLYEEQGENFIKNINGHFIIFIYNFKKNKLLIFTDRLGFLPHYYAQVNDKLLVAPECKAILQDSACKKQIDLHGVADMFAFSKIFGNKTCFKNIQVLPAGSILAYQNNNLSIRKYWDLNYQPDYKTKEGVFVEKMVYVFKKFIKSRTQDNYKYGVSLSGGLDSRTVLAAIPTEKKHDVINFSFGPEKCDEVRAARKISAIQNMNFKHFEVPPEMILKNAEQVASITEFMNYAGVGYILPIHRTIAKNADIVLDGFAMGLSIGGNRLEKFHHINNETQFIRELYQSRMFSDQNFKDLFQEKYYKKIKPLPFMSLKHDIENLQDTSFPNKIDHFIITTHARRFLMQGLVLLRSAIEYIPPLADNDLIDLITKIPPEFRRNHNMHRKFFIKLAPELAKIPYCNTGVRVDFPIVLWDINKRLRAYLEKLKFLRPKVGYVNFSEWLYYNKQWREYFVKLLLSKKTICTQEYLNKDYIIKLFKEHFARQKDNSTRILYIATFELFFRKFFR